MLYFSVYFCRENSLRAENFGEEKGNTANMFYVTSIFLLRAEQLLAKNTPVPCFSPDEIKTQLKI
jgi:hypothetical protein